MGGHIACLPHRQGICSRRRDTQTPAESSLAIVKRGIVGTYHNVSREYLHRYLWQYDFLWNQPLKLNDGERTVAAVKSAEGKRLTYKALISRVMGGGPCQRFLTWERFAMAPSLSYREKTLYASLAAELFVYGPYFFLHQQNSVNKVAGMIVAIIVLQIILQLVIAAFSRNRVTDERDRLIELRGYRAGYLVVASLMVIGLGMLWFHAAMGQLHLDNPKLDFIF